MKELYRKNKSILLWVLFAGYLIFNGILLFRHELWRDEANVWLLARDTTPWQLFNEIKYQGHPCLWYLLVMPFAKLGLPFQTISIISLMIMTAAAGIFVKEAPFSMVTKAVCLFTPIFSYYYPVVARNYCLIAVFLIILAHCYHRRNEYSISYGLMLGLLVQTDTIALWAAGMISLMWLWEGTYNGFKYKNWKIFKNSLKGLWIPLISFVLLLLQFLGVANSPAYGINMLPLKEMIAEIRNFSYYILTRMTGQGQGFDLLLMLLFLAAGILLSWKIKNPFPMIVPAGELMYQAVFSIVVYQLHIWHYIAICFTLIWFLWLGCQPDNRDVMPAGEAEEKRKWNLRIALCGRITSEILLILLGITMFFRWNYPEEVSSLDNALHGLYSDGVHVAEYISDNIEKEEVIISTDIPEASTVLAYLGKDYSFYYAGSKTLESFARYNEAQSQKVTYDELLRWVKTTFPNTDSFYLLKSPNSCITDIPDEAKENWEICYQTVEETARGESYVLYRVFF
ncbi:MAG: hypothetical protein J1D87_00395 [Lachnospiraceae bacterium]|nr:hypothetical protein [Lachnospiraceae bacterium]